MTQPVDRQQIAVTVNGQPIYAPRQVAPGQSQPVGELSDGQPVWPVPSGAESRGGPVPFGVMSSGQPVWTQSSLAPGQPEQTTVTVLPQEGKAARPLYKKKRVLIPAACVVLLGFAAATGDGGSSTDTVATSSAQADANTDEQSAADKKAAADKAAADKAAADKAAADKAAADKAAADKAAADRAAADKAAADKAAAEKAAAAAKGTASQQNAYDAAVDYLNFSAFSRTGLIEQLSSEYGSQFPAADAEFAVTRLEREGGVDWNAEAAEAAKDYLEFSSFSRQGLLDQLTSEHGSQFTPEQAEYGVSQTGL